MKYSFLFLFVLLVFNIGSSQSESLQRLGTHTFKVGKHKGKLHEFEYVFEKHTSLYFQFKSFDRYRRRTVAGNYTGLGLVVGSFIAGSIIIGGGRGSVDPALTGLDIWAVGGLTGVATLLMTKFTSGANKLKRKNILLDNYFRLIRDTQHHSYLDIGLQKNGVGIAYHF